jgi:hypothetical protein
MKYHVGDLISVKIKVQKNGRKSISYGNLSDGSTLEIKKFQVIGLNESMKTYKIIIDDDMIGWQISQFHIDHEGVAKAFLGKRFYDISENHVAETK